MPVSVGRSASSARAVAAVDAILQDPDRPPGFEPDDGPSARAAVEHLAERFASADGWVKAVVDGARAGARGLSGDRLQGLSEIVQNADDAGAGSVRIALQRHALLIAHDGRRVTLSDVFALAAPWVTTKSGIASATGRFGIGLMTLQTIAPTLEVYSGDYRIRLGEPTIAYIEDPDLPGEFARSGDTVFRVPLASGALEAADIDAWFERWDEAALLFCNSVEEISVETGGAPRTLRLRWDERSESTSEVGGNQLAARRRYAHASDGRMWAVHTVAAPPPAGLQRAGRKEVDDVTPLGIALPLHDGERGQVYAGLPIVGIQYPVRINAQFDPLTGRQGLAPESPWNEALCPLLADLWIAAMLDLFETKPTEAWRVVPLSEPINDAKRSTEARLESLLLNAARTTLPARLTFLVSGQRIPLADFAVEVPRLEGIFTDAELADLANLDVALPTVVRDSFGRWRDVLDDWRQAGAALPQPITVETALVRFGGDDLSPKTAVALAAAALAVNLSDELATMRCVVTEDGRHMRPPAPSDPWLFSAEVSGLAAELGLVLLLHPAYQETTDDARAVVGWLAERGAITDPSDVKGVLQRLAAFGQSGNRLTTALSDRQLRALRDAFESLSPTDRTALGPGVGRAILIEAFQYDRRGKPVATSASPSEIYLPKSIDRDPDSFAVAAAEAPGLTWARGRYADVLRSPLGRAGLGAQRFLRLLGAETAPRVLAHDGLERRYESEQKRGLPRFILDDPPGRGQSLSALGATYTLEDRDSPDLAAVLTHIGKDRKAIRRRTRAAAVLATLGRAWDRLSEFAEVPAASDHYAWNIKGSVRAFWVWRAASIPWLDDNTATPSAPADLRLRTPSTVAVHGPNAPGYIHKDVFVARHDVLAALGVSGEPSTGDLVNRLIDLRDSPADPASVATDAALAYLGLADRIAGRAHIPGDLSIGELRQAFASGAGLVRTNLGWRPPSRVLAGAPVFGDRRAFAPSVPGAERLWTTLKIRPPSVDDCVAVLNDLARSRSSLGIADQTTALETLRLLAELVDDATVSPGMRRRLSKLPLWTTLGWQTTRPVYAIDDPILADGLAAEVPVWLPGGELTQFRALLGRLHLTEIDAESTSIVDTSAADLDEEATELLRAAIPILHEDLARNDPTTEGALDVGWDRLSTFEVRISSDLRVRVSSLRDAPPIVSVVAKADPDAGALYLTDPELLTRVDGGGRAIAGLFTADRRRVAQAWLAACDGARLGREAQRLQLAQERAVEEEAKTAADIADRLATFRHQTEMAHGRRPAARADRTPRASAAGTSSAAPPSSEQRTPRVLVDPNELRVADPRGHLVDGHAKKKAVTRGGSISKEEKDLPEPRSGGAVPRQTAAPASYTPGSKELVGLELVRMVLASDAEEMRDLRAQHGVGADAVDSLERFFELKVYAGSEPDRITLEESQIRRAMNTPDFFLVVVSGVEGKKATPQVRVIVDPLAQLEMTETSSVSFTGVRTSQSLVYQLVSEE